MEKTQMTHEQERRAIDILQKQEVPSVFPSMEELDVMDRVAEFVLNSKKFTDFKTKDEIMTIFLKARALKIDGLHALSKVNVFQGNVTSSAELQMHLILRSFPTALKILEYDNTHAYIKVVRPGMEKPFEYTFTLEDAVQSGKCILTEPGKKYQVKVGYQKIETWIADEGGDIFDQDRNGNLYLGPYHRNISDMLRSRVVSKTARSVFPDVIEGVSYNESDFPEQIKNNSKRNTKTVTKKVEIAHQVKNGKIEPITMPVKVELIECPGCHKIGFDKVEKKCMECNKTLKEIRESKKKPAKKVQLQKQQPLPVKNEPIDPLKEFQNAIGTEEFVPASDLIEEEAPEEEISEEELFDDDRLF
jgi:hypothetical protein